jgi:hypothetical protein
MKSLQRNTENLMSRNNPHISMANMRSVLALQQNLTAKHEWQCEANFRGGYAVADRLIAKKYGYPVSTVKAARFYW